MTPYLASDWHLGHEKLLELEARPPDWEKLISRRLNGLCAGDLLIFLGDGFLYEKGRKWMKAVLEMLTMNGVKKMSIHGNHDANGIEAMMDLGWDFACDSFTMRYHRKSILFSHEPVTDHVTDLNIHGHLHTMNGHGSRPPLIRDRRHILISSELCQYHPVTLDRVLQIGTPRWNGRQFIAADETFKPKAAYQTVDGEPCDGNGRILPDLPA